MHGTDTHTKRMQQNFTDCFNLLRGIEFSWETESHSHGQEIPHLLWNMNVITMFKKKLAESHP